MELNGDVRIDAPRPRVWAALNDSEVLRRCIPGCEAMADDGEGGRTATVAVKVGPVRARFSGRVRMDDVRPGEGCTLQFEGQGGAAGMARGASRVELLDDGGGTRLRYETKASVAGKLGQVGGRMIDAAARQIADQFFAALQTELAPQAAAVPDAGAGPAGVATAAAPSAAHLLAAESAAAPAASAPLPSVPPAASAALPGDLVAPSAGQAAGGTSATPVPPLSASRPGDAPSPAAEAGLPAAAAAAPLPPRVPVASPATGTAAGGESVRVLWFVLGALSTGFGVWLGRALLG